MQGVFDVLGCHRVGWNGLRPPLGRASMSNVWLLLFGGVMAPTLTLNNAFEEAFTANQDVVQSAWKQHMRLEYKLYMIERVTIKTPPK